jgi:hypothetical protein
MNSGVSNCIEVRKFWEYSTALRSNIFDRVRIIFCKIFIEFISNSNCIVSNYIDLSRTVRLSPLPISVVPFCLRRKLYTFKSPESSKKPNLI